jgi:hypothetical protein
VKGSLQMTLQVKHPSQKLGCTHTHAHTHVHTQLSCLIMITLNQKLSPQHADELQWHCAMFCLRGS